jgi:general L-amino acid transport system permease protein
MTATTPGIEALRPPGPPGPLDWARQNLFNNWYNSLLTIFLLGLISWGLYGVLRWVFLIADWRPVTDHLLLYLVGQYPRGDLWRLGVPIAAVSILFGLGWRIWGGVMRVVAIMHALFLAGIAVWPRSAESVTPAIRLFLAANLGLLLLGYLIGKSRFVTPRRVLVAWLLVLAASLVLLLGLPGVDWLPVIPTGLWGGLLVTLILAVGGIVLSFPIGVLLALGRRSSLPVISFFCTVFIEVIRGVPLIGVLVMVSLLVPLFLPVEARIDRLLRALIGFVVFTAAYMAENVRGGLAAIPLGQVEAARAVGLNGFQTTFLIVLPQALRIVIPPIVGQFITLFKDTTLAAGIAVLEFLAIGQSILQANPQYFGLQMEMLLFIAAVFWVFCYLMSYASLRLESRLGVGER